MIDEKTLLASIPAGLRTPLLDSYREIARNFQEHRWEPSELNGGKFCEIVYCIVDGNLKGVYPSGPSKPQNMVTACRAIENIQLVATHVGARSLKILIPRMLQPLYEIRNNRGVGHAGGDVNPNQMDAAAVFGMASWILAELVRVFHGVTTAQAQDAVNALVERKLPLVWEIDGAKRVLDPNMNKKDQALVLLYQSLGWVSDGELVDWVEYSSLSMFRTRVLEPLHTSRLVEFDKKGARVRLSPLGSKEVEDRLLSQLK